MTGGPERGAAEGRPVPASHWASFQHEAASVPQARHVLRRVLDGAGVDDDPGDDIEIVLSEIVGNAVRHAQPLDDGDIHVRCEVSWSLPAGAEAPAGPGTHVEIAVTDGGAPGRTVPGEPVMPAPGSSATSGRGLGIVDDLADDWGVVEDLDTLHRTVWASFGGPRRPGGAPQLPVPPQASRPPRHS